ncbi:hypothetical protein QG516_09440 [Pedobacter gandavensis]|uniref:phosphoribosyltransferase-like protein n=1 Tax=Pedobacter gandavensis TaxID=2679963 RepID=UPI0024796266|nr:hypothetical protein [Pedobacter gandavensis]WGQ11863.1 hypothetical protein QG516_09440 [Pedobacter gandavensis]
MSAEILDVFSEEVDLIVSRMDHRRSRTQIAKWLDNFGEEDKIDALEILQKLTYVSEDELRIEANRMVEEIVAVAPDDSVFYFYPVEKYSKSATLLSYYIGKSPLFHQLESAGKAKFLFHKYLVEDASFDETTVLVFFDDFFGTGDSLGKYYNYVGRLSKPEFKDVKHVFAAAMYCMDIAKVNIQGMLPHAVIVGDIHHRIFKEEHLFFSTSVQNEKKKKLAHDYAERKFLFRQDSINYNLGYKDSEALICFAYMPPNNTLPIIWSGKSKWYPLLPRSEDDVLERLKEYKLQNAYAAASLELSLPSDFPGLPGFNITRITIVGILRMLYNKVTIPRIALVLNLRSAELDQYFEVAINMGYLNESIKLTNRGKEILADILEKVAEFKSEHNKRVIKKEIKYMPKIISGK